MKKTFVADIRHFLDESGEFAASVPAPARKLAEYFGSVIAQATSHQSRRRPDVISVPCRGRFGKKKCSGSIVSLIQDDGTIRWACGVCADNGYIRGWQQTAWDTRGVPAAETPDDAGRVVPSVFFTRDAEKTTLNRFLFEFAAMLYECLCADKSLSRRLSQNNVGNRRVVEFCVYTVPAQVCENLLFCGGGVTGI